MKLLKCEVCGSNDLTKKDGLFVCDYCGAKYSLEEVQKMAVQGRMDITGNISIDNSDRLQRFVKAACDALLETDFEGSAKYAEEALMVDPNNADALLVLGYYQSISDPTNDKGYCNRARKNIENTLGMITQEKLEAIDEKVVMYVVNTDKRRGYTVFVDDRKIADDLKPRMVALYMGRSGEVKINVYAKWQVYVGWINVKKGMIAKIIPSILGADLLFDTRMD